MFYREKKSTCVDVYSYLYWKEERWLLDIRKAQVAEEGWVEKSVLTSKKS